MTINPPTDAECGEAAIDLCIDLWALRNLLEKPEAWTKTANARTASGMPTSVNDPAAVCWCLSGAIAKLMPPGARLLAVRASLAQAYPAMLDKERDLKMVMRFNDDPATTHARVLEVIDAAIALAVD